MGEGPWRKVWSNYCFLYFFTPRPPPTCVERVPHTSRKPVLASLTCQPGRSRAGHITPPQSSSWLYRYALAPFSYPVLRAFKCLLVVIKRLSFCVLCTLRSVLCSILLSANKFMVSIYLVLCKLFWQIVMSMAVNPYPHLFFSLIRIRNADPMRIHAWVRIRMDPSWSGYV